MYVLYKRTDVKLSNSIATVGIKRNIDQYNQVKKRLRSEAKAALIFQALGDQLSLSAELKHILAQKGSNARSLIN